MNLCLKNLFTRTKSDEKIIGFTVLIVLLLTVVMSTIWYYILQSFLSGLDVSIQEILHGYPQLLIVRPDFWILFMDFIIGALIYYKISSPVRMKECVFPTCKICVFIAMTFPLYSDVIGQLFILGAFSISYLVMAVIFASLAFAALRTRTMAGIILFIPPMFFFYFIYLLDLMNVPIDMAILVTFLYYGIASIIDLLLMRPVGDEESVTRTDDNE